MHSESQQITAKGAPPQVDVDEQLIATILEKSREGKIVWDKGKDAYRTTTAGAAMAINLEIANIPIFGRKWMLFNVWRNGEEILRLENSNSTLAGIVGVALSRSHIRVSELFAYLESARLMQVRTALDELERL